MTSQQHLRLDFQKHSASVSQLYWNPGLLITCQVTIVKWFYLLFQKIQTSKTWSGYSKLSKNLTKHSIVVLRDSEDLHTTVTQRFKIVSLSSSYQVFNSTKIRPSNGNKSIVMITLYFSKVSLAKIFILFSSILLIQHAVCLQILEQTTNNFYNKDVTKVAFQLSSFLI